MEELDTKTPPVATEIGKKLGSESGGDNMPATEKNNHNNRPTDEPEDEIKHQLQSAWKFWYFENNKEKSWEDNLKVVSPFQTVEDFWSIYNHIKSASDLRTGCSYFVFKDGIKPMWEDTGNRAGGRWLVSFDKRQRSHLDHYWMEVVRNPILMSQ